MGFDEKTLNFIKLWFKASLLCFVVSILIFISMVIMNFYWNVDMSFLNSFGTPLAILFFGSLLCLIITGGIKLIVLLDSKAVKNVKKSNLVMIEEDENKTVIKKEKSKQSVNAPGLIVCGILIIAGLILFIYGDITYNKLHGSYIFANFFSVNLAQYELMRIGGGLMSVAGFLGLIFVGLSK